MPLDAGALHCPNCGSPAAPGDAVCKYCKSTLATVSCPSCFALMFEGAIYCPACGARRARSASGDRHARCPGCRGMMREVLLGATALLECERCRGMWLDATTFERVCADRETQAAVLYQWPSVARPVAAGEVHYRKCVACGKLMNRLNFGRLSGTIVDACKGHGTYLDAGELHLIVTFIQGGGLDRARQRQIDDLNDAERALASRQGPGQQILEQPSWSGFDLLALMKHLSDK
jgi:Zn-finger nucleic acid-binding protein